MSYKQTPKADVVDDLKSTGKLGRRNWSADESKAVYCGVQRFGIVNWVAIAKFVKNGRTNNDVKSKWHNLQKIKVK